jgi:hypothetical protein
MGSGCTNCPDSGESVTLGEEDDVLAHLNVTVLSLPSTSDAGREVGWANG